MREKEEDIVRVKKQLESSREVMSSSSSQFESSNSDQIVLLQMHIKNLERDLSLAREKEKTSESIIQEKDKQLRKLSTNNPAVNTN